MRRDQSISAFGRVLLLLAAGALCLAALAPGCRGRDRGVGADEPSSQRRGPEVVAPEQIAGPRGLEVQLWVVDDMGGQVASALRGLDEPAASIPPGDARRWRDSGLRVVGVAPERIDALRAELQLAAPVRREWVGQLLAWRTLALGPGLFGEQVTTAGGVVDVDEGRLRLMARAWAAPGVVGDRAPSAPLRVELLPQVVEPRGAQTLGQIEARLRGELRGVREDGPVLERLALSATLDGGEALVIVGESPRADWDEQARLGAVRLEQLRADAAGPPGAGPGVEGEAPEIDSAWIENAPARIADPWDAAAGAVGPEVPEPRTLGESMLTSPLATRLEEVGDGRVLRPRRRVLIVLVPHTSGAYTIAPARVAGGG